MRSLVLIPICVLVAGCAQRISISRAALPCSAMVPAQLRDDVPGADLPADPANIVDQQVFGDAQTGQLEKSNAYKGASLSIIQSCEQRDREIDAALTKRKKVLGIF